MHSRSPGPAIDKSSTVRACGSLQLLQSCVNTFCRANLSCKDKTMYLSSRLANAGCYYYKACLHIRIAWDGGSATWNPVLGRFYRIETGV